MSGRVNSLAVLLAVIAQIVVGFGWYGFLFEAQWLEAVGIPPETAEAADGTAMAVPMAVSIASAVAIAILLSIVLRRSADWGIGGGLKWGFLLWLLLALPMLAIPNAWAGRGWMLTAIDGGEALVALLVAGAIVGAWPPKGARTAA